MAKTASFLVLIMLVIPSMAQDVEGECCDPDGGDEAGYAGISVCGGVPVAPYTGAGNCDPDCGSITGDCTTIPLDGGLSLLALAGGGLATAAMRRRREEEEAAHEAA